MTDLDTKLRGEKTAGYCSDSDDDEDGCVVLKATDDNLNTGIPLQAKTGPKGVLQDYKLYKKLEQLEKEENDRHTIELQKKLAFTADPNKHPDNEDEEFEEDDEFLRIYHEKRLAQMKAEMEIKLNKSKQTFDQMFDYSGQELVDAIEEQDKNSVMVVHIYDSISACMQMNKCLEQLAQEYSHIKFCKVLASNAGLSLQFKMNALPTIQVYKDSKLIGNYLRVQDHLDKEFYPGDVENFLLDADVLCNSKHLASL